jgi:hypothetical protein
MVAPSRTLIVVPAYNEEVKLAGAIESNAPLFRGPTSQWSAMRLVMGARISRVQREWLLKLPYNMGIGGVVQTGYAFACEQGYDVELQIDGDGQHDLIYVPVLRYSLEVDSSDLVIGSRFIGPTSFHCSVARRAGIQWFAKVVSLLIGQRVTDTTSGFRAANRRTTQLFAADYPQDYPEPESMVLAHCAGLRLCEVPVEMHPRRGGRLSISPWRSVYYMVKVTLAILTSVVRPISLQGRDL